MFDVTEIRQGDLVDVFLDTSEEYRGIIVRLGGDYLVVKLYSDWVFLGYQFFVNQHIENVVKVKPALHIEKIVIAEEMDKVSDEYLLLSRLGRSSELLDELQQSRRVCAFHEVDGHLTLGQVGLITGKDIWIWRIFIDFEYDEKPFRLPKKDIVSIELGSEYVRIFDRYSEDAFDRTITVSGEE